MSETTALERRIYSSYAFTENEQEKSKINYEIYSEIKDKAKVRYVRSGYAHKVYEVVSNPEGLNTLQLALICDGGNLCFGYRLQGGNIVIHTD